MPKQYNQVANYVYTEQATNIKVGKLPPKEYLAKVLQQTKDGVFDISTLDSGKDLERNLELNDIPAILYTATHLDYNEFLIRRRQLMALKIKDYYEKL